MEFSGELISIKPSTIKAGLPVDLNVQFTVATSSFWEKINGWWCKITITLDGMEGSKISTYIFGSSKTLFYKINVGPDVMPNYDLNGFVTILCSKGGFSSYQETVYDEPITIRVMTEGVLGGFPIIPVLVGAGGLLILAVALSQKRK